jgi:hypothetical protein
MINKKTFLSLDNNDIEGNNNYNRSRVVDCTEFNVYQLFLSFYHREYNYVRKFNIESNPEFMERFNEQILSVYSHSEKISRYNRSCDRKKAHDLDYYIYIFDHIELVIYMEFADEKINIIFFSSKEDGRVADIIEKIAEVVPEFKNEHKNKFHVICFNDGYFFTKAINLAPVKMQAITLAECYNDDFIETSEHIMDQLQNGNKGIVLLYGDPGTGKTTYLKHIISQLGNKEIIYLPPDMAHLISKPEFFTFLLDHKNAILLIEDAENVLKHRDAGDSQAVSNLLNVSDGILGDGLQFQIIATLNSKLSDVDTALLRPGRLIASYHFGSLEVSKANALLTKVYGEGTTTDKCLTLAEAFNIKEKKFVKNKKDNPIGFIN